MVVPLFLIFARIAFAVCFVFQEGVSGRGVSGNSTLLIFSELDCRYFISLLLLSLPFLVK